ncbi:MAG: signal recognition particle subunit SRP19/SEC65 family protein [Thermoproteus sp.]
MKKKGGRILWLLYIDATVPRSRGRILSKKIAVPRPTVEEVAKALDSLGVKYEVYRDKKHPALWFDERGAGYVLVYTDNLKEVARKVAEEIAKSRR